VAAGLALFLRSSPASQSLPGLEGRWRGVLHTGLADLTVEITIEKSGDRYTGKLLSIEQGATAKANAITADGDAVHFEFKDINGKFDGKFDAAAGAITGTWSQGKPLPLVLTRHTRPQPAPGREVDAYVPVPPTAFPGVGKTHLVYELRITNASAADVNLKQIDVLGDGPLASFSGSALGSVLAQTRIAAGADSLAYLWVTLEPATPIPARIHHKLTFDTRSIEAADVAVATGPLPVLGPPLHGDAWLAANGPVNGSPHRRALTPIAGTSWIAQRFAIDWVKVGSNDQTYKGDKKDNKNYFAYGSEVLAVADAMVVTIKDGIPQNVPGETSRAVPITLETIGGNHIILDLGNGRFAFYAHLQPGSLRVKVGDHVTRSQVIALVGNSGNSTEPHLHFHVADRNSPLASEGMPYLLESFGVQGKGKQYDKQEKQLPLAGDMVKFD